MKKIGITTRATHAQGKELLLTTEIGVGNTYVESVRLAGALPILLPTNCTEAELVVYAEMLDGIIFTGGVDIHPQCFNEPQLQGLGEVDTARDSNDFRLMAWAFQHKLPIFGICRGCQLLNVYRGGTLYQDLQYIETKIAHTQQERGSLAHQVQATRQSKLYQLFGEQETFMVNSHHHQAVKTLGEGLIATLKADDGVIEGIELQSADHYVVAVQYHPEVFYNTPELSYMLTAFKRFVLALA